MRTANRVVILAFLFVVGHPSSAPAQMHKLRVVSADSQPIAYAYINVAGGVGQITDEKGEISFGQGKKRALSVTVRRMGYQPWSGRLEFPDTAATLTVMLPGLTQQLATVAVSGTPGARTSLGLQPFYDRWMMRQKGTLSATFIGPEELEQRNPSKITDMLNGLSGVHLKHLPNGGYAALNSVDCPMAIVVDGDRRCPAGGCNAPIGGGEPVAVRSGGDGKGVTIRRPGGAEGNFIDLNQEVNGGDVAAIEVYARGGNMPVSLQVSDQACGVIAIWTGSRKP